ncbi:MAG: glycosyltransferase family 4 protein [Actinobacteria bacterium]|nr:glycosyltransferase family 4 protein [Actinomycetota bacterium]
MRDPRRTAILVTSHPGQRTVEQLEQDATAGRRPRVDYVELAKAIDGEVFDLHRLRAGLPDGRLSSRLIDQPSGRAAAQVWTALRSLGHHDRVVAWADRLGLPLALLAKATRRDIDLVMVSVLLTSPKKRVLLRNLRAHTHLRAIVTPSSVQAAKAVDVLGVPAEKIHHFPQRVDHRFWRPAPDPKSRVISSVGWENRDYSTLVRAVDALDATVEIAVGSVVLGPATSSKAGRSALEALRQTSGYRRLREWEQVFAERPANVEISHQLSHLELRELYERSAFCVLPLHEIDTDNGATALAEAMAMGKAVVVTKTTGQVDILRDGEHGLTVPPGDVRAMRQAIQHLVDNPELAAAMGRAGRAEVERRHTLDGYIDRLTQLLGN